MTTTLFRSCRISMLLAFGFVLSNSRFGKCQAFDPMQNIGLPTTIMHGTDIEHIDLQSGALVVNIPLLHQKGRGVDTDLLLTYTSKLWKYKFVDLGFTSWDQAYFAGAGNAGWSIGVPRMGGIVEDINTQNIQDGPPGGIESLVFEQSDGSRATLVDNIGIECFNCSTQTSNFWSYDNSYMTATYNTVHYKDGIHTGTIDQILQDGSRYRARFLEDTNGNRITCTATGDTGTPTVRDVYIEDDSSSWNGTGDQLFTNCSDTLGRTTTTQLDPSGGYIQSISYSDVNGATQSIQFHYQPYHVKFLNDPTDPCPTDSYVTSCEITDAGTFPLLTSVVLADGETYSFAYRMNDDGETTSGELSRLTYPTGGYVRYSYDFSVTSPDFVVNTSGRIVTGRFVSPDGSAASEQAWSYKQSYNDFQHYTSSVTDPVGNVHSEIFFNDNSTDITDIWTAGIPASVQSKDTDSAGHVLRQIDKTLGFNSSQFSVLTTDGNYRNNPYVSFATTTTPAGTFSVSTPQSAFGNILSKQTYDFDGTLIEQIDYSYLAEVRPEYADPSVNLLTPVASISVQNMGRSTCVYPVSGLCSRSTFEYDDYGADGLSNRSGISGHNDVDYSISTVHRGNLTSESRLIAGGSSVGRSYKYDIAGNRTAASDWNNNVTTYDYTDNYYGGNPTQPTFAFATSETRPATNGTRHVNRKQYYLNTGTDAAFCGENYPGGSACAAHLATPMPDYKSYSYDLMGRIVREEFGDGGFTALKYLDVNHIELQNAIGFDQRAVYDGLGRESQTQLLSDPDGVDYVDTHYDALGRVSSKSNPYRGSDNTGTTYFQYDALGRITRQTQQDNNTLWWCYDGVPTNSQPNCHARVPGVVAPGTWVDASDETGRHWQRTSDTLDHLTQVMEPDNGNNPVLETDYSYDGLGLLRTVNQSGLSETTRSRRFTYDSLARLLTSTNPEAGTICYGIWSGGNCVNGYDSNGNLLAKTDARGVTVNYSYDALNRLISKTYAGEKNSDGSTPSNHPTPSTCYLFDSENNSGSNTSGRLVAEWTQPGNCPSNSTGIPASAVSWKDGMSYEPMGRLTAELQCAVAPCAAPSPLQYMYDLAGNLRYSSNGLANSQSPQVGWTNSYDGAGRLKSVISNWVDSTHPATLFQADATAASALGVPAAYSPFGGLVAAFYGVDSIANTVAVSDTRTYDNRFRLTSKNVLGAATLIVTTANVTMSPPAFDPTSSATATMHVDCNSACGLVDIKVDTTDLGTQSLDASGNVTISSSSFPASARSIGSHTITVLYLGNGGYASSSGSTTYTVTTQQTTVDFSMNPSAFTTAEDPQVLIHVSCNSACGQVSLSVDGHPWIPAYDVDSNGNYPGWANIWYWQSPYLIPGSHTITANYLGNATYAPSSGSTTVTINPIGTQQTSVNLSLDPPLFATVEDAVVSTHVGCNSACGQVLYTIDGNNWVVFNLDSNGNTGVDSYWWQSQYFTTGNHTLTANYLGNSTYAPVSQSSNFTIAPVGTQPANVTQTPNTTTFSPSDIFYTDINVGCNCAGSMVEVTVDGNQWVLVHLDDTGRGTVSTTWAGNAYFTPGTHTVSVHFLGNTTYAPTDSNSVTVTVGPYK